MYDAFITNRLNKVSAVEHSDIYYLLDWGSMSLPYKFSFCDGWNGFLMTLKNQYLSNVWQ